MKSLLNLVIDRFPFVSFVHLVDQPAEKLKMIFSKLILNRRAGQGDPVAKAVTLKEKLFKFIMQFRAFVVIDANPGAARQAVKKALHLATKFRVDSDILIRHDK